MRRGNGWLVAALVAGPALTGGARLAAQDSEFGIRSLGTPGRWESVRARATAGAFAPFDPLSPLTEAPLADLGHITATAMASTSWRTVTIGDTSSALRATRFPLMLLAGQVAPRLALAAGFTTYLDKSWDVTTRDSVVLRGVTERYTDEFASDGSVADLRLAAASRVSPRLALGAAAHVLTGSARLSAQRTFDDTIYHAVRQTSDVRYDGLGVSGSALLGLAPGLSVALWGRADNRLRAKVAGATTAETDLPRMVGGGVRLAPSPSVRLAAAAAWRSWSHAGPGSFNTWSWSAGSELGGGPSPIRLGVRWGQLPFGPGPTAPTEFAVAAGTVRTFSQGHALIDFALERLERKGSGLDERLWTLLVGITVRP
ncbi:MAG TPA: hypothetical protein VEU55_07325 [Gemmatimonadales bacterium]|nr:hypothetical protein [Gemmatimonadales bacterium]